MKIPNCVDCAHMKMRVGWRSARCIQGRIRRSTSDRGNAGRKSEPIYFVLSSEKQRMKPMEPRKAWEYAQQCPDFESMDND